ncbi:MAG: dockerin type I domain-containing protein [candidate division Zixibacteria bacterium]|nr:dockerin type I domain-containing protein [candidate division Zixibacteria bacterium]
MQKCIFWLIPMTAVIFVLLFLNVASGTDISQSPEDAQQVMKDILAMPLAFTDNAGQQDQNVLPQVANDGERAIPPGRSVAEFLTPDGRFDLEATRRSGYQGSLDMKGFESAIDSATGQPIFRPSGTAAAADNPDDIYWDNGISPCIPGVCGNYWYDGYVLAMIIYDGKLIVGGRFTIAGCVFANNIVAWDGSSWSSLGSGTNNSVYTLTMYDGRLIAGGDFTTAGGVAANYIASWDGSSWSSLGSGTNSSVRALTVYNEILIAGGNFTMTGGVAANYIASWDGSSWSSLGSGTNSSVFALTVYNEILIAGGCFTMADGVAANKIASWNGSSWDSLGSGMDDCVFALTVYDGKLIAGGDFATAGGVAARLIASWDGSSWSPLGSGMNTDQVLALTVYDGKLIAAGFMTTVDSWDGSVWSSLGSEMDDYVHALTVYDGKLIAGGDFTTAGGVAVWRIASWDGSNWSSLVSAMNGLVSALTVYDGKLIAGGTFTTAGGVAAHRIASWDGSSWDSLGSGMNSAGLALTVYDGKLIAGGSFTSAGGVAANRIASWDGSSWDSLGLGMNGSVSALTVYDGKLIAGGYFNMAGGVAANRLASWDGSSWSPLGSGVGAEESAGGAAANRIASWDGSSWSPLGLGMNDNVYALTVYDGKLIAGGWFTTAGGVAANCTASWDGSSWSPLGTGMSGTVDALTVYDGKLIAGGWFTTAGGVAARLIASWDGSSWSPLGSGVEGIDPLVNALTVYGGKMIAGGEFTIAGNKVSAYLAAWTFSFDTDIAMISILAPSDTLIVGSQISPMAIIQNNGKSEESFPTVFQIGSVYLDTVNITLALHQIDTITFSPWPAANIGTYTARCFATLDNDQCPYNDSLMKSITVIPSGFTILSVSPSTGGNTGIVTIDIAGRLFESGARVKLTVSGQPDIIADSNVTFILDSSNIRAIFNLTNQELGIRNVVVINPGGDSAVYNSGLSIEAGFENLWYSIEGRNEIRINRWQTYTLRYGNSGNICEYDVMLWISSPPGISITSDIPTFPDSSSFTPVVVDTMLLWNILITKLRPGEEGQLILNCNVPLPQNEIRVNLCTAVSLGSLTDIFNSVRLDKGGYRANAPNYDEPPPGSAGAILFVGPHEENMFGHDAFYDGNGGVIDHYLHTELSNEFPEETIPFAQWRSHYAGLGSAYKGYGFPPGYSEEIGQAACDEYKKFLYDGTPYSVLGFWGGGPNNAVNCVGIAQQSYYKAGLPLDNWQFKATPRKLYLSITHRNDFCEPEDPRVFSIDSLNIWGLIYEMPPDVYAGKFLSPDGSKIFIPIGSCDPNDKVATDGFGSGHYILPELNTMYTIYFENVDSATASAENIQIVDTLDLNLDWNTLQFQEIYPGDGPDSIRPDYAASYNFDSVNGVLNWNLANINLPADTAPYWGEGWVSYSIKPKANLPTGTKIENIASIKFDENDWILAPMDSLAIFNTIDAGSPFSRINSLPDTTTSLRFNLSWLGHDDSLGSGIKSYAVYYRDTMDTKYTLMVEDVVSNSTEFTGQHGHTYQFYTIAEDNVGHTEIAPKPDSLLGMTTIWYPYICGDVNGNGLINIQDITFLINYLYKGGPAPNPLEIADVNHTGMANIQDITYLINYLYKDGSAPDCLGSGLLYASNKRSVAVDSGSVRCIVNDGKTIISITSPVEIYGLEMKLRSADSSTINLESNTGLDLFFKQESNEITLGLLDPQGKIFIPKGTNIILTVAGWVQIDSVLGADVNACPIYFKTAGPILPREFSLEQNYPNPFNPSTTIRFGLPKRVETKLDIYNILGQKVTTLIDGILEAGFHEVRWNGVDSYGHEAATGVYLYRLKAGEFSKTKKMLILK